jgi:uncharacterized paraquat-inducible protein A
MPTLSERPTCAQTGQHLAKLGLGHRRRGSLHPGELLSSADRAAWCRGASTILGGVEELVAAWQYPLPALILFASVLVPMLKLVRLSIMLIATQTGRAGWLRDRTRLYHIVRFIGRWSMIDIFMESLLGALVVFGSVITIEPALVPLRFAAP